MSSTQTKKHDALKAILRWVLIPVKICVFLLICLCAIIARFVPKKIDFGLGPLPLINNIYHKAVFEKLGYTAETFVNQVWHITAEFDVRGDKHPLYKIPFVNRIYTLLYLTVISLFRYKCIVIYFNGSTLGVSNTMLWRFEPIIYKIAGVKTIVLAYGADVQDMARSPNLWFKDAMSKDYPNHKKVRKRIEKKIDLWTVHGDHVVGGCEWVDYMHHWDTLMISHFSIDTDLWTPASKTEKTGPFKVFHAPNHRNIKGTQHVIEAVEELKQEGLDIELLMIEKRPNHEVRELIQTVDVIVDQLIVGWYAMFAIEAMALKKPVICYLRDDLKDLYKTSGLLGKNEDIPLISATPLTIKDTLRDLYGRRNELQIIGENGREYVMRHHSIEAVAKTFGNIAEQTLGPKEPAKV